jgi:hypothetical protein
MGEAQNQPFQLSFNPRLRIEFQGSRVTSDGGAWARSMEDCGNPKRKRREKPLSHEARKAGSA